MRVRRRTLALALPVALVLGLGACSSDDLAPVTPSAAPTSEAPSETLTAEPTETPEPEPRESGPTPPARPVAMDDTGKKGAQAAAEYFIALVAYSYAHGDTGPLENMSYASTCTACSSIINDAGQVSDRGYSSTWGKTDLSDFEVRDKDDLTGAFAVAMAYSEPAGEMRNAAGDVVDQWDADTGWMQFDAMHDGNQWRAMAIVTDQDAAE